jgi:hypothetical protein
VRAILPADALHIDEPQIRLIDQGGRLQAMPKTLPRQASAGDAMEFLVDERNQPLQRGLIPLMPRQEQPGDITGKGSDGAFYATNRGVTVSPSISRLW